MSNAVLHLPLPAGLIPFDAKLRATQEKMRQLPQTYIPLQHFFGGGMYTRVMMAPAGTAIIGKRHLHAQHNFLLLGSIKLFGEDGETILHAPEVIVSPAGTKRAAITLTDVIWATTLATDLDDPDEIERQLIDPIDQDIPPHLEKEDQP